MTKQEIRRELSIYFLQGLKGVMSEDRQLDIVTVQVKFVEKPDYSKAGTFVINFFQN